MIFLYTEHQIIGEMFLKFTKKEIQTIITDEETALKLRDLQMRAKVGLLLIYNQHIYFHWISLNCIASQENFL